MKPDTTSPARVALLLAVRDRHLGLSASAQRDRLLEALQSCGDVTTFEGSRFLDLYDPRARALELRRHGHDIVATWREVNTEAGQRHRIGVHSLRRRGTHG